MLIAVGVFACEEDDAYQCATDSACPGGYACLSGRCELVCGADSDCGGPTICQDGLCRTGSRQRPSITQVYGSGSDRCTDAVSGRCFTNQWLVEGANLDGARFVLKGARSYTLTASASFHTGRTVVLPTDLEPGPYTLVATNAAGDAEIGVQVLRGEPGPASSGNELVDRLNAAETTRQLSVGRMPAANDLLTLLNQGSLKLDADLLPDTVAPATLTGEELILSINDAVSETLSVAVLPDGAALMRRINAGDVSLSAALLPSADAIIQKLQQGTGGQLLPSSILPAAAGGAAMTGPQIITAINGTANVAIDADNLPLADALVTRLGGASGNVKLPANILPAAQGGSAMTGADIIAAINGDTTTSLSINKLPTANDIITRINSGTDGSLDSLLLSPDALLSRLNQATGTIAPSLSVNVDSTNYVLSIDQTKDGCSPQAVDDARLLGLCGDGDGCTVSLAAQGVSAGGTFRHKHMGKPCRFSIGSNRDWSVNDSCALAFNTAGGAWQEYASGLYDRDGTASDSFNVIQLNVGGAWVCYFSETKPAPESCTPADDGTYPLLAADTPGFFFWRKAVAALQLAGRDPYTCELVIQD